MRPFLTAAVDAKISIHAGRFPLWGPKGQRDELYFVNLSGGMMAASVKLSPTLTLGTVKKLFECVKPRPGPSGMPYDMSPIAGRFLTTTPEINYGKYNLN